jgi:hypothetical protein
MKRLAADGARPTLHCRSREGGNPASSFFATLHLFQGPSVVSHFEFIKSHNAVIAASTETKNQ